MSLRLSHFHFELGILMLFACSEPEAQLCDCRCSYGDCDAQGNNPCSAKYCMGLRARTTCSASPWFLVRPYQSAEAHSGTHASVRNAKRTLENIAGGNVELSSDDLSEIDRVLSSHAVKGGRYFDAVPDEKLGLWG